MQEYYLKKIKDSLMSEDATVVLFHKQQFENLKKKRQKKKKSPLNTFCFTAQ